MKPYIVYIKEGPKDGYVKIKESELKRLIEQAYDNGYEEGKKTNWWTYNPSITYTKTTGTVPTYINNPTPTNPDLYKYEVTCSGETANSVGD